MAVYISHCFIPLFVEKEIKRINKVLSLINEITDENISIYSNTLPYLFGSLRLAKAFSHLNGMELINKFSKCYNISETNKTKYKYSLLDYFIIVPSGWYLWIQEFYIKSFCCLLTTALIILLMNLYQLLSLYIICIIIGIIIIIMTFIYILRYKKIATPEPKTLIENKIVIQNENLDPIEDKINNFEAEEIRMASYTSDPLQENNVIMTSIDNMHMSDKRRGAIILNESYLNKLRSNNLKCFVIINYYYLTMKYYNRNYEKYTEHC
jgi:hypothetical protein